MKKKKKTDKIPYPHLLEYEYDREFEYICPVRGKVKQIVKVKKYRSPLAAGVYRAQQKMKSILEKAEQAAKQLDVKYNGGDE